METKDKAKFNIVLVMGVIEKEGKYLIAQRSLDEPQAPGTWSLPGGKVEVETKKDELNVLEETLKKEIVEEVGIEVEDEMFYVRSSSFIRNDGAPVVGVLFLCKWKSGKATPLEDSIDIAWISIDEIPNYEFAEGINNALKIADQKLKRINCNGSEF